MHIPDHIFRKIRDRSQTLVRGAWCKKGGLKFLTLVRGVLKKITTDFPLKIEFTCFSKGSTRNIHGKKGGPEFFAVWRRGGARKFFALNIFLHKPSPPPYKCLWTVPEQVLMVSNYTETGDVLETIRRFHRQFPNQWTPCILTIMDNYNKYVRNGNSGRSYSETAFWNLLIVSRTLPVSVYFKP